MASSDYVIKNRGFITATKIKTFMRCPQQYYLQFVLEEPEMDDHEDEARHFVIGRAFDEFMALYQRHGLSVAETKWKEKWRILGVRQRKQREFDLSNGEGLLLQSAIAEACRQPSFDLAHPYNTHHLLEAEYAAKNGVVLQLRGELDRLSVEKKIIRDFKLHRDVSKFEFDLDEGPSYHVQASFYHTLAFLNYDGLDCDFIFDVVGKGVSQSYSAAFRVGRPNLDAHRLYIKEALESLAVCQERNEWPPVIPEMRLQRCIREKCPMYRHCPATAIQENFIEV